MSEENYTDRLAIIPYIGGSSKDSTEAIIDLLSYGDTLQKVRLLSSETDEESGTKRHGFFLSFERLGYFIVPRGYASGYGGTGPTQLSNALMVFESYGVDPREITLDADAFHRLRRQCLSNADIDKIESSHDAHCGNTSEYILEHTWKRYNDILPRYSPRLPLSLLHPSIQPLKSLIFSAPEDALRRAYIILESKIRDLSGSNQHGTKLFDNVLKPKQGVLQLKKCEDDGEQAGIQNFIKGLYQLHRNPLMHRDLNKDHLSIHSAISELLLINHALHLSENLEKRPETKASKQEK